MTPRELKVIRTTVKAWMADEEDVVGTAYAKTVQELLDLYESDEVLMETFDTLESFCSYAEGSFDGKTTEAEQVFWSSLVKLGALSSRQDYMILCNALLDNHVVGVGDDVEKAIRQDKVEEALDLLGATPAEPDDLFADEYDGEEEIGDHPIAREPPQH